MMNFSIPVQVLLTSVISTFATGLGAIPVMLLPKKSRRVSGAVHALAGGFMISASVFNIGLEALHTGTPGELAGGLLAGSLFIWFTSRHDRRHHAPETPHHLSLRSQTVLIALFLHSIPEGLAIGVGFATGNAQFGLLMAIAISIHNIPEGMTMSLPLKKQGASGARCFWYSVLTSLPQAILALPSYWIVEHIRFLLPTALSFAGGAMIYLVMIDLLPESYESTDRTTVGWSFVIGLVVMMLLTVWLEGVL